MASKDFIIIDDQDDVISHLRTQNPDECGLFVTDTFNVGYHITKGKKLSETLNELSCKRPYQIFLTARSSHFKISDDEILKCATIVERKKLKIFVHTPYLLNLANNEEYIVESLRNHLTVCGQMKFMGCVVHVGKSVKKPIEEAMQNMRQNILQSIEVASPSCPLLLETPAGQGTETLQKCEEFIEFIQSFNSKNLYACVDTCHVFANGHDPLEYIRKVNEKGLLKLIHFNDSKDCFGSCKDRHAFIGMGNIGIHKLREIAEYSKEIPMLVE